MISKSLPAEIRQIWKEIERLRARVGGHFVADSVAVELAQDAVGNILTDTTTVNFTYDDGTPTISADVIQSAIDHGNIGGLSDDDHAQYHNDTRGDARYVQKSTFDANTILKADTDNTPSALTVAEQTLVGRMTGGNIDDLSASDAAFIVQGSIDHGSIAGLSDDDHSQYILATGTRTGATSQAQTFTSGVIDSSLTDSRLLASNGSKQLASVGNLADWIAGTANQVTVSNDGDGSVTLSLPQNIHTAATPTFAGVVAAYLRPAADSTTALQLQNAAGTAILNVDTTNKRVGINNTAPLDLLDMIGDGAVGRLRLRTYIASAAGGAELVMTRARGSLASPTQVKAGDVLGGYYFRAYGSTNFAGAGSNVASIRALAEEDITDTSAACQVEFQLAKTGEVARSTAAILHSSRAWRLNLAHAAPSAAADAVFYYVADHVAGDAGLVVLSETGAVHHFASRYVTPSDIEFSEISDPAAPATNKARLFARDDGSGKTQLCVRFSSGAVQVLATEP